MNFNWLNELEEDLEKSLNEFLQANPYQELLLKQQNEKDRLESLNQQRKHIQYEAKNLRKEILNLAESLEKWNYRAKKARNAEAISLANRADEHLNLLMNKGRQLWEELKQLGIRFKENETQIEALSKHAKSESPVLEEDWTQFETEQELEELLRKRDLM